MDQIKSVTGSCDSGRRIRGPSEIKNQTREVFSFEGGPHKCTFAYSFEISATLCLVVSCGSRHDGQIFLDAGFTPPNIPLDLLLNAALEQNAEFSTQCFSNGVHWEEDVEVKNCLITKGDYLARVDMTPGPQSIVQVEIWSDSVHLSGRVTNGESVGDVTVVDYLSRGPHPIENVSLLPVACVVEIVNVLGVSLKNGQVFMRKTESNISPPNQVLSFTREMFCIADALVVEGMFSYEIEETDLKLVVAFKCEGGKNNCFCGTIVPLETELDEAKLDNLMDPTKTWKTFESRKYAQATYEEQFIVARNIHVRVNMTNGKVSTLKIFLLST